MPAGAAAFLDLDETELSDLVDALVKEYADQNLPGRGVRMEYLIDRIRRNLKSLLAFVQRDLRQSGFAPAALELRIDDRPDPDDPDAPRIPPVELTDGQGHTVRIVGAVDRLDVMKLGDTAYLRVVDYKTGTKKFDLREVWYGLDCQMLMYLFTLERNADALRPLLGDRAAEQVRAAGVEYLWADPSPATQPRPDADADTAAKAYPMEGLLLDEESVYRAMDTAGSGEFSPLAYKNGKVYYASAKKSLAGADKLARIRDHLDGLLRRMAENLYAGRIAAEPLCPGGSRTPCDWCDYRAVCRHADGVAERSAPLPEDPFAAPPAGRPAQTKRPAQGRTLRPKEVGPMADAAQNPIRFTPAQAGGHLRPRRQPAGIRRGRFRQDPRAGGAGGGPDYRPRLPGGGRQPSDHDLYQRRRRQAAGRHHRAPWPRSPRPPRRPAPAPPADAAAKGVHRHGGRLLPAVRAAAFCLAGHPARLYHRDDADLFRIRQQVLEERWSRRIRTRISAPLPTCSTGAAPMPPPARRCWRSMISTAPCLIRNDRCRTLRPCGRPARRRRTPCGAKRCWPRRWPACRAPAGCWPPPWSAPPRDDAVSAAYAAALIDDDAGLERLERRLAAGDWDAAVQEAAGFGWARLGRIKGGKAGNPAAFAASELRTRAKKRIDQLKTDLLLCTGAEFAADRAAAAPLAAALVRAVQDFSGRYFEAKVAEKLLDYADYEHLTLELLQDADGQRTPLCATVSAQYSAVLVDEYQDTNALQDAIYYALAKPDASNLFFVGDIKQSIYRFRQAEPSVFIEKQKAWPAWPVAEGPATIALDANFRSAPNVIASVNYIFETIFSAQLGGVDYGPGQRLVVGREGDYPGLCELDVIDGADAAGDARAIAARIGELCAAGFAVRDGDATRPCTPGDLLHPAAHPRRLCRLRGRFAPGGHPGLCRHRRRPAGRAPCAPLCGAFGGHRQSGPGCGAGGGAAQPMFPFTPTTWSACAGRFGAAACTARCFPARTPSSKPLPILWPSTAAWPAPCRWTR